MSEGNQEKNPNQFGQRRDLNSKLSEYESNAVNFIGAVLCAFKNFIKDRPIRVGGSWNRVSIFNRCNDANVRTLKLPLVHASLLYHVHAVASCYK